MLLQAGKILRRYFRLQIEIPLEKVIRQNCSTVSLIKDVIKILDFGVLNLGFYVFETSMVVDHYDDLMIFTDIDDILYLPNVGIQYE